MQKEPLLSNPSTIFFLSKIQFHIYFFLQKTVKLSTQKKKKNLLNSNQDKRKMPNLTLKLTEQVWAYSVWNKGNTRTSNGKIVLENPNFPTHQPTLPPETETNTVTGLETAEERLGRRLKRRRLGKRLQRREEEGKT